MSLNEILTGFTPSSAFGGSSFGYKAAFKLEALGGGLNLRKKVVEGKQEYPLEFRTWRGRRFMYVVYLFHYLFY